MYYGLVNFKFADDKLYLEQKLGIDMFIKQIQGNVHPMMLCNYSPGDKIILPVRIGSILCKCS